MTNKPFIERVIFLFGIARPSWESTRDQQFYGRLESCPLLRWFQWRVYYLPLQHYFGTKEVLHPPIFGVVVFLKYFLTPPSTHEFFVFCYRRSLRGVPRAFLYCTLRVAWISRCCHLDRDDDDDYRIQTCSLRCWEWMQEKDTMWFCRYTKKDVFSLQDLKSGYMWYKWEKGLSSLVKDCCHRWQLLFIHLIWRWEVAFDWRDEK